MSRKWPSRDRKIFNESDSFDVIMDMQLQEVLVKLLRFFKEVVQRVKNKETGIAKDVNG